MYGDYFSAIDTLFAMDRLPQELLGMIAKYVNIGKECVCSEDLMHLRLVNRPWSIAAAVPLFRVMPLWINLESLQILLNIANHPYL